MIKSGMCSITFRGKTPEQVIALALEAGLAGIEWGGDRHVPPTDLKNAERVGQWTRAAGLEVAAYGSYCFAFDKPGEPLPDCYSVIETAVALGAPIVRIWAGSFFIEKTSAYFQRVVGQSRRLAAAAEMQGIKVAFEFHPDTFSQTVESTLELLRAADHPNLYAYWQPPNDSDLEQRLKELAALKSQLLHLHLFHWKPAPQPPYERRPLAEGAILWESCLLAADAPETERYALLEFVRNDDPEQFLQDAAVLNGWLKKVELAE